MPPPPGRRRTRSNRAGKSTAVEDFARYSVEDVQARCRRRREGGDAAAEEGKRGSGARKYIAVEDLAPLLSGLPQRGTRSSGATKPTAAGDVARLLGEVAKKSSHPRISLPLCYFCYICTFSTFECGDARVCVTHWRHAAWGLIYCTKRFNHTRPLVKCGRVYRWSDEKLNSGLGRRPKG